MLIFPVVLLEKKILSVRQQVYLVEYNFPNIETQENQKWFFTTLDPTPPPWKTMECRWYFRLSLVKPIAERLNPFKIVLLNTKDLILVLH